jgi:hypothetical protein
MGWKFTDAPDQIDFRWGSDLNQQADATAQQIIESWSFEPGYEP